MSSAITTRILKGADVANAMREDISARAAALRARGVVPTLAIVRIGEREDDLTYERMALKKCEAAGVATETFVFPADIAHDAFAAEFSRINALDRIHGILAFRPFPKTIDENAIKMAIDPAKDIDCMSPVNLAKLFAGDATGFAPCTAEAVIRFLAHHGIPTEGANVTVIGRSMVIGRPVAMLLLQQNATVTICHTRTRDLARACAGADIVVAAVGKARMVTRDMIPEGAVVIDVGINVDAAGNLAGDVDAAGVDCKAACISPVPGGIGAVTTSVLAEHVVRAAEISAGRTGGA